VRTGQVAGGALHVIMKITRQAAPQAALQLRAGTFVLIVGPGRTDVAEGVYGNLLVAQPFGQR
jgi:hypothetical protein